jgi:hypothetical protein
VAAALLGPLLLLRQALFWGTPALQFVPWWGFAWNTVEKGHLPLWNPLVGMGAPLLANYQSGLFYPPYWIYLVLDLIGGTVLMAWGQALVVGLHLIWAGLGMSFLVRRLGLGDLAQAVSGLAFGFSGYLVARSNFLSINATVAWLPWILLCLTPIPGHPALRAPRFTGLFVCLSLLLLAGHAQTAWYTLILAGFWSAYWGYRNPSSRIFGKQLPQTQFISLRGSLIAWLYLGLAVIIAAGLVAVQLLPTAEYLGQSQRASAVEYELALTYSFWPWRLLGLVAPGLFGSPASGDYWGYANFWEDAIYIGLLPFLLAMSAILRAGRDTINRRISDAREAVSPGLSPGFVFFLVAVWLIAFGLALGRNTPLYPWLYLNVPTFSLFQAPTRWMLLGLFSLALLAGIGAERWRRPEKRALYWTRLGTMGAFAISVGAGLALYLMGDVSPSFIRAAALTGFLGVVAGILSLLAPRSTSATIVTEVPKSNLQYRWKWGVAFFIAFDLFLAGNGLLPGIDADFYRQRLKIHLETGDGRIYLPAEVEEVLKFERFLSFETFFPGEDWAMMRAVRLPNLAMLDIQPSVNNFDPLVPGRYAAWMERFSSLDEALQQELLPLMGVSAVETIDPDHPGGVRFDPVVDASRVHWAPCAVYVSSAAQAFSLVFSGELNLDDQVVLETSDGAPDQPCSAHAQPSEAIRLNLEEDGPNKILLRVEAPAPGWLLLSDTWYPGWSAWVNGQPTEIQRADYLFRAVRVPVGASTVEFQYKPFSFWSGLVISLSCLVGWLVFLLVWRRAKKGGK